jgi:hypothetical protein
VGYSRRVAKRKGFSDGPDMIVERVTFIEERITWPRERLY